MPVGRARTSNRPSTGAANSLVASARPIALKAGKGLAKQVRRRDEWMTDAWNYFDEIPEFKHGVWLSGNAMAKLRLYIGVLPDGGEGDPINVDADLPEGTQLPVEQALVDAAKILLGKLRGPLGGLSEIQRELDMNLNIAGMCYLVRIGERTVANAATGDVVITAEEWDVKSVLELEIKNDKIRVQDVLGDWLELDEDKGDKAITVWQRHPGRGGKPDANTRALINDFEILLGLTQQQKAETWSRASAGVVLVPQEMTFASPDSGSDSIDDEDEVGVPDETGDEAQDSDPLLDALQAQLSGPIEDASDPAAITPLLLRGPGEHLEKFRHITFERTADSTLNEKIEQRVRRIARGMNLPVETTLGHQDTTYANAEQVDQDTFDDYYEPRAVLGVDALTGAYLQPELAAQGFDLRQVERVVVWFDASRLVKQPDRNANADAAFAAGAISESTYRKARGFDDGDAPDDTERLRNLINRKAILTADLTRGLFEYLGIIIPIAPVPSVSISVPAGASVDEASKAAGGAAAAFPLQELLELRATCDETDRPVVDFLLERHRRALIAAATSGVKDTSTLGRALMEIDRELRTKVHAAADSAMERALDKAGARLRSKVSKSAAAKAIAATSTNLALASQLGPELVLTTASIDDLFAEAFDALEAPFLKWAEQAGQAGLNLVSRTVSSMTKGERETYELRLLADSEEAWAWLRGKLTSLAHAKLFDPAPFVEALGEFDGVSRVPAGLIREAIARAGGGAGVETRGAGDARVMISNGNRPVGGIAQGQTMMGALEAEGYGTEAYQWVYGPAPRMRPFEPHLSLDGVTFLNFDDPVLANTSGFPEIEYYVPGDHAGCVCDFAAVIIPPAPGKQGGASAAPTGQE